jgi:hypothetical protein
MEPSVFVEISPCGVPWVWSPSTFADSAFSVLFDACSSSVMAT